MNIIAILLALICIGLPAFGIVYFARPPERAKTVLLLAAFSIALGGGMFWFGRMLTDMEGNTYYTVRTKKLLERTVQRLEDPREVAALARDLRCLNERFGVTYGRTDVAELFAEIEGANTKPAVPR